MALKIRDQDSNFGPLSSLHEHLLTFADRIHDVIASTHPSFEFPRICTKQCPGNKTPIITPIRIVDHKSVETDPLPAPVPLDDNPAMDLDIPAPPRPTYAEVAVSTLSPADKSPEPNPRHPPTLRIPPASRPKSHPIKNPVLNPVRLVVRPSQTMFRQKPFAKILISGPANPFRLLHHALSLSPSTSGITLLGVHVNRSENLIVSLPHSTSDAHVDAVTTVIHSTFSPLVNFPLLITHDVAWTKFMVSSVPARPNSGDPTFSEEEVLASFMLNPAIKPLSIMRSPRWIRNPAAISGAHSSFTFSFIDPDGSIGQSLAKSRLFMFGEPVHLKRWTDKPRQTRGVKPTNVPI
ncbi:hypothetical protein RhiJN_17793 [Ceratobasidium sp. AG-Ba]|nr:hypothetical protein RhiJN_17793 [Ceratobasidium sp. AG-Ba]